MSRDKVVQTPTAALITALLSFADSRGHWPSCPQSRRVACYTTYDGPDEVPRACSARCRKARTAIEAAGGTVEQRIGYRPGPSKRCVRYPDGWDHGTMFCDHVRQEAAS